MSKSVPLFKSHFSLGKSILTLEKPTGKADSYPISIFDLVKLNGLDTVVLVEDCISGLLQASKVADENNVKLVFGLRLDVSDDMNQKDEPSLLKRAKYIIFAKNPKGYETLIKIWSLAANQGFYYSPNIDFKSLKSLWNENVILAVPFYDSFLYLNSLASHAHVPDLDGLGEVPFFVESNELPFDDILLNRVTEYCSKSGRSMLPSQSIYYKSPDDYLAYVAFKCLHNRGYTKKATLESPNLDHMTSDQFSFDKWLKQSKG
jgi:DNA polymerase III alpha subunit